MTSVISAVTLEAVRAARERLADVVVRTPLVRLTAARVARDAGEVYLKLENLQPIGSFKLRGAANAIALAGDRAWTDFSFIRSPTPL